MPKHARDAREFVLKIQHMPDRYRVTLPKVLLDELEDDESIVLLAIVTRQTLTLRRAKEIKAIY